jgi:hypothetical protein
MFQMLGDGELVEQSNIFGQNADHAFHAHRLRGDVVTVDAHLTPDRRRFVPAPFGPMSAPMPPLRLMEVSATAIRQSAR